MADTSGISTGRVELLTGLNYQIWALKVAAILRSKKLFRPVIEGHEPPIASDATGIAVRDTWEEKNDEAFGIIIVTLAPEQAGIFIGETKAKKVWLELKRIHEGNIEDRKIDTALELKNLKMKEYEKIDEYIMRARNIAIKSASLGQVFTDREIVYHVVRGLHHKFENISIVLRTQRGLTLEEIKQILSEEEEKNKLENGKNFARKGYTTEKVFKAKTNPGNDKKCYNCGKKGHIAKQCWQKSNRDNNYRPNNNWTRRDQENKYQPKSRETAKTANVEQAFTARQGIRYKPAEWSLDSACTQHMTNDKETMEEIEPYNAKIDIAEEGGTIEAIAKGKIRFSLQLENGDERHGCMSKVLYVPKLKTNLMSIHSLMLAGNKIVFENMKATVYDKENKLIAETKEKGKMYNLILKPKLETENNGNACMNVIEKSEVRNELSKKSLWHKRLGHMSEEYMDLLNNKNMVMGLNYNKEKLKICGPCCQGKMTQKSFKKIDCIESKQKLELIHMDLCGPLPESIGGAKYLYVIVDDYSRRIFVSFLKTKADTFEKFKEIKMRRECETKSKITRVRSDNGTEFINEKFENYFKQNGIKHEKTVTYSPQSNGIAERCNRSILEKVRTMLFDSKLPYEFWAEAAATAVYLLNTSPHKKNGDITPMEKWNDRKPNLTHVKVFGCLAYFFVPKQLRRKLEARSKKGIFVGYSTSRKAYRIYEPIEKLIYESRSVTFDEQEYGIQLLNNHIEIDELNMLNYDELMKGIKCEHDETNVEIDGVTGKEEEELQIPDVPPNDLINADVNKKGRKKGDTQEKLKEAHMQKLARQETLLTEQGVRRSTRIKDKEQSMSARAETNETPSTYEEVKINPESKKWEKAMEEEIASLESHEVWELVSRPRDNKVIKSKWVFKKGIVTTDNALKYKARLVAMGQYQKPGVDYAETFSPVMKLETFRILMALSAHMDLQLRQYDVKTAYLHGNLDETVFMEQPKGYEKKDPDTWVCRLRKSIYGLPQSGRNWNLKFDKILTSEGMTRTKGDPCLYIKREEDRIVLIGIYVDDMIIAGTDNDIIEKIVRKIQNHVETTETKDHLIFLGIEIDENKTRIKLSQTNYAQKILKKYNLDTCNEVKTPGVSRQNLHIFEDSEKVDQTVYQEMLGSLMYLANSTRPDIAFNVSYLSQFSRDPRQIHFTALKRVYRYLKGTITYGIHMSRSTGKLTTYTDSGWCTTEDAKAFAGFTTRLGKALITWKSKKQQVVALSTCEAELMGISEGLKEVMWITKLLDELGFTHYIEEPVEIKTDSKSAKDWIYSNMSQARTKHVNRNLHFIKDEVKAGKIRIEHIRGDTMEADIMTKNSSNEIFWNCVKMLELG